jgi:hypothetical protein
LLKYFLVLAAWVCWVRRCPSPATTSSASEFRPLFLSCETYRPLIVLFNFYLNRLLLQRLPNGVHEICFQLPGVQGPIPPKRLDL